MAKSVKHLCENSETIGWPALLEINRFMMDSAIKLMKDKLGLSQVKFG